MLEGDEWGRTDSGTSIRLSKSVCSTPLSSRVASNELTKISIRSEYVNTALHPKFSFPHASSAPTLSPSISARCRFRFSAFLHVALVFQASALQGSDIHLRHSRHTKFFPLCPPVFPTHHRPHSASSRCVPLPSNLTLTGTSSPSSARQNPRPEPGGHAASRRTTRTQTSGKTSRHVDCRPRHIIPLDRLSGWPLQART
jgi:hypothetical protein